ncbi:MAG TPA: hypothetical protein VK619_14435 [Pyrinomonadaceae bacterium]|nr:hypothetical protein [Pyrinomonadaceae bacterium]
MRKMFAALSVIGLLFIGSVARPQSTPRFEDYSAPVYRGRRAPVNLSSTRGANSFRTRLREGASEGVNFAGHYTLVQWGCGAGCVDAAIIDAKTGTVYFPNELGGFPIYYWSDNDEGLQFKPNSRLLVLSGAPASEANSDNPKTGLYYYQWTGTRLRLVKFVPKSREDAH